MRHMPWFPDDWIDEVVTGNDIVDVIGEYVVLKPSGRGYFGLCPFHNEKSASFHVSPEKQTYHCFGCGEGGNVISFVMGLERMEFVDTLKHLAERASIPLPDTVDTTQYVKAKDVKEKLYEINRECAKYYHQMLFADDGREALSYLESRGTDMHTIKTFGIGFAPDSWDSTRNFLKAKGFDDQKLLDVGITVENKDKGRIYDRFRNRIIFPIIHPRGMVLGFGGRVMDNSLPKYLNSPDSPTFNKSANLFGLNLTNKVRPLEYMIIVEGYMDVISLYQYGFPQAVASLGTSLTTDQAKLLRRHASEVYIAYDGDAAGQNATLRGLDILQEAGCRVKVLKFPNGLDPDEILKKYGSEYFKKLMSQSLSFVDYKLEKLQEKYDLSTSDGRVDFGTEASNVIVKVDNLIERDTHIQRLESMIGIKSRVLYDQIQKIQDKQGQSSLQRNINGNNRYTRDKKSLRILHSSHIKAELYLVNLMAQGEVNAKKIINGLRDLILQEPLHQEVVEIVKGLLERKRDVSGAQILSHIEDIEKVKKLVDIFNQEMEYDNIDTFISDCLDQIRGNYLEEQRQELQREITTMDKEGISDPDRYRSLLKELQQLNQKVSADRLERRELREKRRV